MNISSKEVLYGSAHKLQAIPRRTLPKGFRERLQASLGTLQANITKNDRDLSSNPPSPRPVPDRPA